MLWFSWCDWHMAGPRGVRSLALSWNFFSRSSRRRNRQCSRRRKPEAGSFCPELATVSRMHTVKGSRSSYAFSTLCPGASSAKSSRDCLLRYGMPEFGCDLGKRLQHKAPSRHLGMRNGQLRRIHDSVSEQQNVDVDRARALLDECAGAPSRFQCAAIQPSAVQAAPRFPGPSRSLGTRADR